MNATFLGTVPSEKLNGRRFNDFISYRVDDRLDEVDRRIIRNADDGKIAHVYKLYNSNEEYRKRVDRLHSFGYIYPEDWSVVTILPVFENGVIWSPDCDE